MLTLTGTGLVSLRSRVCGRSEEAVRTKERNALERAKLRTSIDLIRSPTSGGQVERYHVDAVLRPGSERNPGI